MNVDEIRIRRLARQDAKFRLVAAQSLDLLDALLDILQNEQVLAFAGKRIRYAWLDRLPITRVSLYDAGDQFDFQDICLLIDSFDSGLAGDESALDELGVQLPQQKSESLSSQFQTPVLIEQRPGLAAFEETPVEKNDGRRTQERMRFGDTSWFRRKLRQGWTWRDGRRLLKVFPTLARLYFLAELDGRVLLHIGANRNFRDQRRQAGKYASAAETFFRRGQGHKKIGIL